MGKTKQNGILHRLRRGIMCGALSCALALGMMLTMPEMGMTAKADDDTFEVDGIIYNCFTTGKVRVNGIVDKDKIGPEVHIPATIKPSNSQEEYKVVEINMSALSCTKIKKITLEEGIEIIESWAFDRTSITEIQIPASVKRIGAKVFGGSNNIKKVCFKGVEPPELVSDDWLGSNTNNITIEIPDGANIDIWKGALALSNNNFEIKFYTPSSSTPTFSPNQEENNNGEVEVIEEEPVNRIPEHVCQYEWEAVREVGTDQDGLEQYLCKLCGNVQSTLTIPASHYQVQELYTKVTGAAEGETVTYDLGSVHTICDKLFAKLQGRKDITLVITYKYKGENYRTTFPAGADYTELLQDADQFYGMLGLNGRCGITTIDVKG